MQGETWQDYGSVGTQLLGRWEVEQAIARLERMWDEAQAQAHDGVDVDSGLCAQDRCAC